MLNFYVSFVVNQNKLLRNSRIAGDMRRRDSCDTAVLEFPQQINCQNFFVESLVSCWLSLSGVPDYFYRNKISSGGDLSHYSSASLY